ncbi:BRD4-interacting chromatin-remodeling complex-associated protein-like isoform X2 [Gadus macrocephalus]|nr:BRD4-interacting chromatin-remodeling complex-associated protein-like isoform X2 [Gadus macrocephalus]XP_059892581.1 BRD4-interacting chromatin-remodeling complex-associated protein-like isoform X2 [Gadus macrocephalus]XP_059892582.1 BRD4-interacting chromatin-remodeling complex-associated protein-like isoform X2 [Gadus macrocephalus]
MDDEDDRRLLDIIGDVDALNDYLHGCKSIEEDDVTNAAYGSDGSFFAGNTAGSNAGIKDDSSAMGEFGPDAGEGLQLSSSLSFIEEELGPGRSPGAEDLGGEDQPFDILQKSLMEADITEQTLAQEALLDSQPAPSPVQAPAAPFPSQLVSGGYGGALGSATTATTASVFPANQFIQGVSQLPNGSAQHIQVLGSFSSGGGGVMTLSSLDRSPQIVLRQGAPAGATAGGQVFAPTQAQVGLPFKNIPMQNIIIQRGPGGAQTIVRPIQPKPLAAGTQAVYSLGLQSTPSTMASIVNANAAGSGAHYTANGSIVVHSPQQQTQGQTNIPSGQFLLPSSLSLAPSNSNSGPSDGNTLVSNQNTVQIVTGQNFTATPGGHLIVNQVSTGHVGGAVTQTWTSFTDTNTVQTSSTSARLTLVGPPTTEVGGQVSAGSVHRLLVTQTPSGTALSHLPGTDATVNDQLEYRQDSQSPGLKQDPRQPKLLNLHAVNTMMTNQDSTLNVQVNAQKRPAFPPLSKGGMVIQRLRNDHAGVDTPDLRRYASLDDALHRLLPYHVFQGTPPSIHEFSHVDEEFETVATQVLKRTHVMVNKYRRLLMVEAERTCPSSEMVMIDRTFNQEERTYLTQDKRMVLVDPDGFFEDFCCGTRASAVPEPCPSPSPSSPGWRQTGRDSTQSPYRTDRQPGYGDPGGGSGGVGGPPLAPPPPHLEGRGVADMKRTQQQQHYGASAPSNDSLNATSHYPLANPSSAAVGDTPAGPTQYQPSNPTQFPHQQSPSPPDTDSVLEAAVNSILEC